MNKVKNNRVLKNISDKTLRAAKGRNIILILAISLTAALFTCVFTIGGSLIDKQQQETMRQVGGSAHSGMKYLTQAEYDILKNDKKLKEISYRIIVGDAVNKELLKLHTEVSYYEDLDARFSFCYPEAGQMPQKEDEIVTSDLVLDALGIPCEIGAKVPLTIDNGQRSYEKTFTLCGYFKGDRISMAQVVCVSKSFSEKEAPTPVTSALDGFIDASDYTGRIMADFNFASSFQIEKQTQDLLARCGFPADSPIGINWAYMGNIDFETVLMTGILIIVILLSGYLIIYNIFYINVYHDIRYYGLLKTVGTTGKQLGKIVRRQASLLSLGGIPLGLLVGALAGKLLLPVVMGNLSTSDSTNTDISLNFWIFAGSALFSFATVFLSSIRPCQTAAKVSAIEAVRYTEGQNEKKSKRKEKKTKQVTPRQMALQNIKRTRGKVVVVVSSLSLALVLLNSIYSLVSGFDMDKYISNLTVSDFSVADATLDNFSVGFGSRVTDGITPEFLEELSKQSGIEETANIYMEYIDPKFTDEAYALIEERIFNNEEVHANLEWMTGNDSEYLQQIQTERQIDGKVFGVGKLIFEKLEKPNGSLDWEKFSGGSYVIATRYGLADDESIDFFLPGEKVTITNADGETREYEVLASADIPYACGSKSFGLFDCNFILPEKEFLDFMKTANPMRTLFNAAPEAEAQTEEWLSDYCSNKNPDLTYTSKSTIVAEFDEHKNMYVMIGGLLSFVVAIIGILNFINTMITAIISRKQELAMMEAVGMTGAQLKKMLLFEGGYYAIFTVFCSILLSSIISITAVRQIGSSFFFFSWHFTITPILLCIPALAAVVLLVPIICYRNMLRTSVVERMHRTE